MGEDQDKTAHEEVSDFLSKIQDCAQRAWDQVPTLVSGEPNLLYLDSQLTRLISYALKARLRVRQMVNEEEEFVPTSITVDAEGVCHD